MTDETPTHLPDYAVCRECGGIKRGIPDVEKYLESRRATTSAKRCDCQRPRRAG